MMPGTHVGTCPACPAHPGCPGCSTRSHHAHAEPATAAAPSCFASWVTYYKSALCVTSFFQISKLRVDLVRCTAAVALQWAPSQDQIWQPAHTRRLQAGVQASSSSSPAAPPASTSAPQPSAHTLHSGARNRHVLWEPACGSGNNPCCCEHQQCCRRAPHSAQDRANTDGDA